MVSDNEFLKIGIGFLETNKYKQAIDFFSRAIETEPANSEAYELRGVAWFRVLNIDSALADTKLALEIDPQNHHAWYNKGEIFLYRKEHAEAEYCYAQADSIYPESRFYLTGLIEASMGQKKYAQAIAYCNQILKESPADKVALGQRSVAHAKMLDYKAAIKDGLKLVEVGRRTATLYNNLGYWYSKIGELKKAQNNLSVSLQLNPTHPYALDNMGHVFYLMGDYKNAFDLINKSLDIDPSNSYAYKNRALVFLKTNEKELALKDLQKAKMLGFSEEYGLEVDSLLKAFPH